jgi:hypothetical protein
MTHIDFKGKYYPLQCNCNSNWSKDRNRHGRKAVTVQASECPVCLYHPWIIVEEEVAVGVQEEKEEQVRRIRIKKKLKDRKRKRGDAIIHSYFFTGMKGSVGLVYIKNKFDERAYIGPAAGIEQLDDEEDILDWGAKFPVDMAKKLMRLEDEKRE